MHGLEWRGAAVTRGRFHEPGRFGRMFPHLRSLTEFKPGPKELGKPDGVMNGGTQPDATQNNDRIKAGFTFLGQFLDHDITFDPTSSLERQNDPAATRNFRTPAFELDSVYGAGPGAQPFLYESDFPGSLALGKGVAAKAQDGTDLAAPADLPRVPRPAGKGFGHTAIIGDPRNDENQIVSQIHLGIMKVHNRLLREHAGGPENGAREFEEVQRLVRWHYQWLILNEFLPLTCGDDVVADIREHGRRFFRFEGEAYMPVEFSVAAYRFGHSQVRAAYRLTGQTFFQIFPDPPKNPGDPPPDPHNDLRGNRPLDARKRIEWTNFFGPAATPSMKIDPKLNTRLLILPTTVVPEEKKVDGATGQPIANPQTDEVDVAVRSLAERNLRRGMTFNLPSGQAVSSYMGIDPLTDAEVWNGVNGGEGPAPLWFYILREAELRAQGKHLHGVGARIVAEVFIGLLEGDLASYLNHDPKWEPELPKAGDKFTMLDFLQYGAAFGEG